MRLEEGAASPTTFLRVLTPKGGNNLVHPGRARISLRSSSTDTTCRSDLFSTNRRRIVTPIFIGSYVWIADMGLKVKGLVAPEGMGYDE
jgi:hypothetical protein